MTKDASSRSAAPRAGSTPKPAPAPAAGPSLLGMTLEEITAALGAIGEPAYRSKQLYAWIYAKRAVSFESMTNIPSKLRARLAATYLLDRPAIVEVETSTDGTRKYLFGFARARVESVFIPEPSRVTFCISSQAGCALDCRFCLTAQMGFGRHLTAGEIVSQVLVMLDDENLASRPVNIVFMGMGEPLHNYGPVTRAFRLISDPGGVGIPRRRITLSTAGLVPGIRRLAEERLRPRLAVSLNATTDETRSEIMPINRKHPISELLDAAAAFPLPPHGRVTFEYVMLDGVNASGEDATRLIALLRKHRVRAKVNLIPFNPGGGLKYQSPPMEAIRRFRDTLLAAGIPCSIRKNRGRDIAAACGQLAVARAEPQRERR